MEDEERIWQYLGLSYNALIEHIGRIKLSVKQSSGADAYGVHQDTKHDEDVCYFNTGILEIKRMDNFLYNKICIELGYCKNKLNFDFMDVMKLACFLFNEIKDDNRFANESNIPVSIIVATLVKQGLSNFCKC